MSLKEYRRMRKFHKTPEPSGVKDAPKGKRGVKKPLTYVIQKHDASREHYDFRLEVDGVLVSWAVPKGPSMTSSNPRLAMKVEDHPIEYGSFEGVIPKGNYGGGTVMLWDRGTYVERTSSDRLSSEKKIKEGLAQGHITFILTGEKLRGEFALVRLKKKNAPENGWLLIKKHDAEASRYDITKEDKSVATGRSMAEIARQAEKKGEVWHPGKGRLKKSVKPKLSLSARPLSRKEESKEKPPRIRVQEPTTSMTVPEGAWIFEHFFAGPRAVAELRDGSVKLYSRSHLPFDKKYPQVVAGLAKIKRDAVFDGEVVREKNKVIYRIYDLLFLDGKDLRNKPLTERKKCLSKIKVTAPVEISPATTDPSQLEKPVSPTVLIAKKADSVYTGGISTDWLRLRGAVVRGGKTLARVERNVPPLTHLDKIYWPEEKITKGDLIKYYESVADIILPHLRDRPQSMHRQPDGIRNEGFFHKDMNSYVPKQIETVRVESASSQKTINYILCQDRWSLLYMINLGCIELNPWLSRKQNLQNPDFVVIDLDPDDNDFEEVVEVAREVHNVLKKVGAESYCKTSGSSGLHICIPTGGRYDFEVGRLFAETVCRIVHQRMQAFTSVERSPAKRRGKIYLDFLQNRRGQTLAAPYCVRPRPKATVSMPLRWTEVKPGLNPANFTIKTAPRRIARLGDLWKPLLNSAVDIEKCMKRLSRLFDI